LGLKVKTQAFMDAMHWMSYELLALISGLTLYRA